MKNEKEKHSHQLNVRVTDKVVKALKQKADRDGIRVSQIMRILLIAYLQEEVKIGNKKYEVKTVSTSEIEPSLLAYSKREPIKESIAKEGLKVPLIVDEKTNKILDGNNRYSLLDENGIKEAKVIYVDGSKLTRPQINELGKELEKKYNPKEEKN